MDSTLAVLSKVERWCNRGVQILERYIQSRFIEHAASRIPDVITDKRTLSEDSEAPLQNKNASYLFQLPYCEHVEQSSCQCDTVSNFELFQRKDWSSVEKFTILCVLTVYRWSRYIQKWLDQSKPQQWLTSTSPHCSMMMVIIEMNKIAEKKYNRVHQVESESYVMLNCYFRFA